MYEGSTEVKRNKLNLLTHKYALFSMEENEDVQSMFGHHINYDHTDKSLRSLFR